MEPQLGGGEPLAGDLFDGVRGIRYQVGKGLLLVAREVFEHEIRCRLASGRAADSDAHAHEIGARDGSGDVANAVVAPVAPARLELDRVEGDVEFVVQHDQVRRVELVEAQQRRDGAARQVHERVRLRQDEPRAGAAEAPLGDGRVRLLALERCADSARQFVEGHLAHVVAVPGVAGPGVTEPDYKPGVLVQLELLRVREVTRLPERLLRREPLRRPRPGPAPRRSRSTR